MNSKDINIRDKIMYRGSPKDKFRIVISKKEEDVFRLSYDPVGENRNQVIGAICKPTNHGIVACNLASSFTKTKATADEILLTIAYSKNEWARSRLKEMLKEKL